MQSISIATNTLQQFIETLKNFATNYFADELLEFCASIERKLSCTDWVSIQSAINQLGLELDQIQRAFNGGATALGSQIDPAGVDSVTSPLATGFAQTMRSQLNNLVTESRHLSPYFDRLYSLNGKSLNSIEAWILEIECNLVSLSEIRSHFAQEYFNDKTIGQFFAAIRRNCYIKDINIVAMHPEQYSLIINELIQCPNLSSINIYPKIPSHQVAILANATVQSLTISTDILDRDTAEKLAANTHLTCLKLNTANIGSVGAITTLLQSFSLNELKLNCKDITDDAIALLGDTLQNSRIRKLALASDSLGEKGVALIAKNDKLSALSITSKLLTDNIQHAFLINQTLACLELYGRKISRQGLKYFSRNLAKDHPNKLFIKNYMLSLNFIEFREFICQEDIAQLVLSDDDLQQKMNQLNGNKYVQVFPRSCNARCVMLLLNKLGILGDSECNNTKEFEIYSKIWSKPNDIADFQKIINYLCQYEMDLCINEDGDFLDFFLENKVTKQAYQNLFNAKKGSLKVCKNDPISLMEQQQEDAYLLLYLINNLGPHTVVLSYENKEFCLHDPSKGIDIFKQSAAEILNELRTWLYTGISLTLRHLQPVITPKRHGFFTPSVLTTGLEEKEKPVQVCAIK